MKFLTNAGAAIKAKLIALLIFAGDAATRRAIAVTIVGVAVHYGGAALDVEQVDTILAGTLIPLAAAWSHNTIRVKPPEGGE